MHALHSKNRHKQQTVKTNKQAYKTEHTMLMAICCQFLVNVMPSTQIWENRHLLV